MATTRAVNPSGAKLLDESTAHPGSLDKSVFEKKQAPSSGTGQGTVNDNYLKECREDNPEPTSQAGGSRNQVQLSNCRILTPTEELRLNQEFEMAVDLKKLDPAAPSTANFSLFATRTRDGKEERAKIWADKPGKAQDDKADPIVVKTKDVLATQDDYQLGEKVVFELEATHEGAEAPCKSGPVEVGLKCLAKWVGGDNLFFRNDGEFPLFKDDASLVGVLATAVEYVQQMKPGAEETAVCFGYASSAGAANSNRKLSLRRAQAIKAILDRDFETWEALAKVNFTTIDIQQFLSDLHQACGWECDPGAVDGQSGSKTKAAILAFQKECNSRYRYGLKEDGVCGPKTWRGVLRTIHGLIQAEIGGDPAMEPNWNKPKWGHSGKGVYANGEDAATGGDKPEERSVQITFFAPGSEPALVDAPDGDPTNPELNPILNAERYEKEKLERQRRNAERARQAEEERKRGAEKDGGGPTPPTEPEKYRPFEGVLVYIHAEMIRNPNTPAGLSIKRNLSVSPWQYLVPGTIIVDHLQAYYEWYEQVNYGAPWDHKPHIKKTYGEYSEDKQNRILYAWDIWSNIHFGYVGVAVGFDEGTLLDGAGAAQWMGGNVPDGYWKRRMETIGDADVFRALDDPRDQEAIRIGVGLFREKGAAMTVDDLKAAVRLRHAQLGCEPTP